MLTSSTTACSASGLLGELASCPLSSLLPRCPHQTVLPAEWRAHLSVSSLQTALQHDVPVPGHGPLHGQHDLRLGQEGECTHPACPPLVTRDRSSVVPPTASPTRYMAPRVLGYVAVCPRPFPGPNGDHGFISLSLLIEELMSHLFLPLQGSVIVTLVPPWLRQPCGKFLLFCPFFVGHI